MNIYVGNLPYRFRDEQLKELFVVYGEVSSARVIMDKVSGRSKGFGFVEMPNEDEANEAIKGLNGSDQNGRNIVVNESVPKPAQKRNFNNNKFHRREDNRR
ncbi:MAG: RNA-binding protein [Bacteroidales bacterium]|nr:RNA-binding protein [Bacteroidales bacterium]